MGEVPVIGAVSLMYTPVNDSMVGPQKFHRDMNCRKQLHLVVALSDIDKNSGPFTFVPANVSKRLNNEISHHGGRIEDDTILSRLRPGEL